MNIYIYYYIVIPKNIERHTKMPLQILAHFMPLFFHSAFLSQQYIGQTPPGHLLHSLVHYFCWFHDI